MSATEWIRGDLPSVRDAVERLGLDAAVEYEMELIADCASKGDDRWSSITEDDMREALAPIAAEIAEVARYAAETEANRCQCGEATGERCEGDLRSDGCVTVEWMPPQYRESHRAAGNAGVYPHNGALRLRVTTDCAEMLATDDE